MGGGARSPFLRNPMVMCSLVIISMPPEPQHGSYTVHTTPFRRMRSASPANMRSTIRCTTSRGVKCSPGFSFRASLNLRISSSKIVPIVGLSTLSGCRSTFLKRSSTLEKEARFVELADGVIEVELLQHLPHVRS